MNFTAWEVIWIVIGSLYAILGVIWGVCVWKSRPWSLGFFPLHEPATKPSVIESRSLRPRNRRG